MATSRTLEEPGPGPPLSATVSKTYPEPVGAVLRKFTIKCEPGEIVVLLGRSGGGKSTLLDLLAGLVPPDPPPVSGVSPSPPVRGPADGSFVYAFQQPESIPWRTCEGNAFFETDVFGIPRETVAPLVDRLIKLVGLDEFRDILPEQMSSGMRQRMQLARIAARRAPLALLDEPLGAVDQPSKLEIARGVRDLLKEEGTAALWVTHDSLESVTVADRVLLLGDRPISVILERVVNREAGDEAPRDDTPSQETHANLQDQSASLLEELRRIHGRQDRSTAAPAERPSRSAPGAIPRLVGETLPPLVILGIVLLAWEAAVRLRPALRFFLSAPSEWLPMIVKELVQGRLAGDIGVTLEETVAGLSIGLVSGMAVGFAAASRRWITRAIRPYFVGMSAVPLFVLAPAFILWFGVGTGMKVAMAALSCFPFMGHLVLDATTGARGRFYHYLLEAGAHRGRLIAHLVFPSVLDAVLRGLRPAAIAALIGAFLGEFIASSRGLGYYIVFQASRFRVAEVLVGASCLFSVAITVDTSARWLAGKRAAILNRLRL